MPAVLVYWEYDKAGAHITKTVPKLERRFRNRLLCSVIVHRTPDTLCCSSPALINVNSFPSRRHMFLSSCVTINSLHPALTAAKNKIRTRDDPSECTVVLTVAENAESTMIVQPYSTACYIDIMSSLYLGLQSGEAQPCDVNRFYQNRGCLLVRLPVRTTKVVCSCLIPPSPPPTPVTHL